VEEKETGDVGEMDAGVSECLKFGLREEEEITESVDSKRTLNPIRPHSFRDCRGNMGRIKPRR